MYIIVGMTGLYILLCGWIYLIVLGNNNIFLTYLHSVMFWINFQINQIFYSLFLYLILQSIFFSLLWIHEYFVCLSKCIFPSVIFIWILVFFYLFNITSKLPTTYLINISVINFIMKDKTIDNYWLSILVTVLMTLTSEMIINYCY